MGQPPILTLIWIIAIRFLLQMPFCLATLKLSGRSLSDNKKLLRSITHRSNFWCRWRGSNPHGLLAQRILSPPRLPIPTHRHTFINTRLHTLPKKQEGYAGGMLIKFESPHQKSDGFATPFPKRGKSEVAHFESTSSTNSNTPAGVFTV